MNIIEEMKKASKEVEYEGYYYKLSNVVEILILGLMCRMQTLKDIHYWATSKVVRQMLSENFGIWKLPCYSHFTNLVGLLDSNELNKIFMSFFCKLVKNVTGKTVAIDGKTICTTANMQGFESPLHIASAFVVENGITIGQLAVDSTSLQESHYPRHKLSNNLRASIPGRVERVKKREGINVVFGF